MKKVLGLGLLVVLVFLVLIGTSRKREKSIEGLVISISPVGNNDYLIEKTDIIYDLVGTFNSNLVGMPIDQLEISDVEKVIEKDAFVKDAEVFIDGLGVLNILVEQFEPIARVISDSIDGYFVNEGGLIPLSDHFAPRLMVVTGEVPTNLKSKDYSNLIGILSFIKNDSFLNALIEQLYIKDGVVDAYPKIGTVRFIFNNDEDYLTRLDKIKVYYSNILPDNGWGTKTEVDMRFDGQLVVR